MEYTFFTTDVFTDRQFGGNPLAVFPDAEGLNDEQMQLIAREFNFSETIFMFPPENEKHTYKVRIFTPTFELPFAGHPTVGGAFVLATQGYIPLNGAETQIVLEEGIGPVPVTIYADNAGRVTSTELSSRRDSTAATGRPIGRAVGRPAFPWK